MPDTIFMVQREGYDGYNAMWALTQEELFEFFGADCHIQLDIGLSYVTDDLWTFDSFTVTTDSGIQYLIHKNLLPDYMR